MFHATRKVRRRSYLQHQQNQIRFLQVHCQRRKKYLFIYCFLFQEKMSKDFVFLFLLFWNFWQKKCWLLKPHLYDFINAKCRMWQRTFSFESVAVISKLYCCAVVMLCCSEVVLLCNYVVLKLCCCVIMLLCCCAVVLLHCCVGMLLYSCAVALLLICCGQLDNIEVF